MLADQTLAARTLSGLLAILLALVALTSPAAVADPQRAAPRNWEIQARPHQPVSPPLAASPGRHPLRDIPWAEVYLPAGYRPDHPAPMALLLHGSGDRSSTMIEAFSALADKHGVILLAVDSQQYTWDIMFKGAHLRNTTRVPDWGNDVGRIDDTLARAFDDYAIDPARIALIGFSDGAGYGLSLGANNAALFKTVIAFSPGLLTRVDGHARGRVYLAHGEQDRVLPVQPTRDIFAPALRGLGFDVKLRLFQGRHEMPAHLRAEAFDWWLNPQSGSDLAGTAR